MNPMIFERSLFFKSGAVFAQEDHVILFWGEPRDTIDRPQGPALGIARFFSFEELKWRCYPSFLKLKRAQALELFSTSTIAIDWQSPDKNSFVEQFQWIEKSIQEKSAEKAVPVVFERGRHHVLDTDIEAWIARGLQYDNGFLYGAWDQSQGFLGLTPELLVKQTDSKNYATMALAGTTTRELFQKDSSIFLHDRKEYSEHQIVIEDIQKQLESIAQVMVGTTQPYETPTLVHWLTPISFQVHDSIQLENVIHRLHPTAALGCYPRENFYHLMGPLEQREPRGYFGAPFIYSENGNCAHAVVMIRGLFWADGEIKIGSGCGVVKESVLEKEWTELNNKRNSVKKVFGFL